MSFPPPKKKDIIIKTTPKGTIRVKARHGWEDGRDTAFAILLYSASIGTYTTGYQKGQRNEPAS
jgi:hypothetical protein